MMNNNEASEFIRLRQIQKARMDLRRATRALVSSKDNDDLKPIRAIEYDPVNKKLKTDNSDISFAGSFQMQGVLEALFLRQDPAEPLTNKQFLIKHRNFLAGKGIYNSRSLSMARYQIKIRSNLLDLFTIDRSMQVNKIYLNKN